VSNRIDEGKDILLYLDNKRRYLVKVKEGENFHTHKGFVELGSLIGKNFGTRINSSSNVQFIALKPTLADYIQKIARRTQIIYPKDMALLLLYADIGPGSKVVEAGTGSGALTTLLASYVRPDGKIYSYENKANFIEVAEKNLKRAGVSELVTIKKADITHGIEESEVNAVVLDLATPWLVIPHAHRALVGGGVLASFSPTIEQVLKTVEALKSNNFAVIETFECIVRRFQVEMGRTRPETLMIGHTGYITFGRATVA
jgi:tRNA (adenine57-N1/adenine58-N1)-methyltransferase